MITNKKLISVPFVPAVLILFLILFSSTASAATTTSNVVGIDYQYKDWGQYPVIDLLGEKYVPLFEENSQIWQSHVDRLAKLVIDSGESYSFTAGENFDLGQGYSLQVKQIDVDGQKVWLEFDKNGQYVDDQIISTDYDGNSWNCALDNVQDVKNVVVLKVHVNQIFQGATDGIVQIDGIWLIDYANSRTLQTWDKFGDYTLITITNGIDASNLGSLVFKYLVTITDLGTLEGGDESYAKGINNNGQVVGYSDTGTNYGHAFIWQNGVITDLGDLNEQNEDYTEHYSRAEGINDKGQVVGVSSVGIDQVHAFIWQNGVMTDAGTLDNKPCSEASGINDNGQIVGYSDNGMGYDMRAFLWQNGAMTDLGTLHGGDNICAYGINDRGQVVGYSSTLIGASYAFLWENGTMTDLGTFDDSSSCAYGINDKGQVVGYRDTETGEYHAFLWENGTMIDLGTLPGGDNSCACGINNKGQVVGYSDTQTGDKHAFLWQNGTIIDLGTLGGTSSRAYGINDKGQIVGCSDTQTGDSHAALWTLPTPNTRPIAAFSAHPLFGVKPHQVSFKDKSTGSPTSWYWDFGDGNTSIEKNPVHTYYKAGRYSPSLTVGNDIGNDTRTRYNYVVVM